MSLQSQNSREVYEEIIFVKNAWMLFAKKCFPICTIFNQHRRGGVTNLDQIIYKEVFDAEGNHFVFSQDNTAGSE